MKSRRFVLLSCLVLGVLLITGCERRYDAPLPVNGGDLKPPPGGAVPDGPADASGSGSDTSFATPVPQNGAVVVAATSTPFPLPSDAAQGVMVADEVLAARDQALLYIADVYAETVFPDPGVDWFSEDLTPEGLLGRMTYRFTAGDLKLTLSYPVVAPDATIYHISFDNVASGFTWAGDVDAAGTVSEFAVSGTDVTTDESHIGELGYTAVTGWIGYVSSTPAGAQFDDFVTFDFAQGSHAFGVAGLNEAVELEITSLRDQEEPGKYVHFWGRLNCGAAVMDYEGCQLVVERVLSGTDTSDPEPVEGWIGEIRSTAPGAQHSQYFVLSGDYPVRYGISSFVTEDDQMLFDHEELEGLRDTGALLSVSGQLVCGVMDVNGCQIQVKHFEVVGSQTD